MKGFLLRDIFNLTSSVASVAKLDVASAEVKYSNSSCSRAFSLCCQCAGKNDLKLLSAWLLVHASQPHSDKPVTTQRPSLEKSTRAGLELFIRASLNVHRVPNYFSIIEQAYRRTPALLH